MSEKQTVVSDIHNIINIGLEVLEYVRISVWLMTYEECVFPGSANDERDMHNKDICTFALLQKQPLYALTCENLFLNLVETRIN